MLEMLVLWPLILLGIPLLVTTRRRADPRLAFAQLTFLVGPALVSILLLHAIFTSVPANTSMRSEYGFFGYWFKPARLDDLQRNPDIFKILTLPALLPGLFALVVGPRLVARAHGVRMLTIAFVTQMLMAMALYQVPLRIVDAANHRPWVVKTWAEFQGTVLDELQPAILLTMMFGALAIGAILRSLQPEEGLKTERNDDAI